ncbi:unnamed protein product, partial [Rotaria magnacalcarata]
SLMLGFQVNLIRGNKTNLFNLIIDSSKGATSGLICMWNFRLMCGCGFLVDSSEEIKG